MDRADGDRLAAEARARVLIDRQLTLAGWAVQDRGATNLFAGQGVAVREVSLRPGHGRADYLLYVDQKVVGVIEAKPEGTSLSGVEWQSSRYADGLPADVRLAAQTKDGRLRTPDALPAYVALACSVGRVREEIQSKIRTTAGQAGIAGRDIKN